METTLEQFLWVYTICPFVKPVSKMGKMFASYGSYVTLCDFLRGGFVIGWLQTNTPPLNQTEVSYLFADKCRM